MYWFAETAVTAIFALRTNWFELVLSDQTEERMLTKLASLDLGRFLDPSFIELHRMAQSRGTGAVLNLWQMQRALVGSIVGLGAGSLVLLGLDPIIGILAVLTAGPMVLRDWLIEAKRRGLDEIEWLTRRKRNEVEHALTSPRAGLRSRLWKLVVPYHAYFRELTAELRNNALMITDRPASCSVNRAASRAVLISLVLKFNARAANAPWRAKASSSVSTQRPLPS